MPFQLIPSGTQIDFIGKWKLAATASVVFFVIAIAAIPIRGIRLGIDFAGGNEMLVRFDDAVTVDEGAIRAALVAGGRVKDPSVIRFGTGGQKEFLIRFRGSDDVVLPSVSSGGDEAEAEAPVAPDGAAAPDGAVETTEVEPGAAPADAPAASAEDQLDAASADRFARIETDLRERIGPLTVDRVEFVGPTVGAELRRDGLLALFWASLAILAYVAFRFSSRFAPGAVIALIHDVAFTAGVFVLLGMEFDLSILAALLAILGYSLNDTIIIYDRIRENLELHTKTAMPEVINLSINQTLARTILTSATTLMTVTVLYLFGGDVIRPFAFAMLIGISVGIYSTIYIASPITLLLERQGGGAKAR